MSNEVTADFLDRIALLLELKGENPFKIRSYRSAAGALRDLEEDAQDLFQAGRLQKVKGIGKGISQSIGEFLERGSATILDELEAEVPEGLLEMTGLRGLGPGRVKTLHQELGVTTLGELEYACLENRLVELKGFGPETQARILDAIALGKKYACLFHLHYAVQTLEEAVRLLEQDPAVERAALSGQARRYLEVVDRGVVVAATGDAGGVLERFAQSAFAAEVQADGPHRLRGVHTYGLPLEVHAVPPETFPFQLWRTTGSKAHCEEIRRRGERMGFAFGPEGMTRGGELLAPGEETDLYRALDLAYIPPELREHEESIRAAEQGTFSRLLKGEELLGVLHVHTTYSDGRNHIKEMAEAARAQGYRYLGISDHSRSAFYAGGLSVEELEQQGKEIDRLNKQLGDFTVLKGIESDILKDGSLDYPDEVLAGLDFVIASVHSGFQMDRDTMTERIVKAVRNPHTKILGHPTGRLLLGREAYAVDLEAVLKACAAEGVMVELNANPHRLDIDWRLIPECIRLGISVAINPDAHSVEGLGDLRYGVGTARKGGLESAQVANSLTAEVLLARWRGEP